MSDDLKTAMRILQHYPIKPIYLEKKTKNVLKIHCEKRTYALKRTTIKKQRNILKLYSIFHDFPSLGIVPIYRTTNGNVFVNDSTQSFYLMPWMEGSIVDEKNASILFYHLAKLHKKTKQEINIPLVQLENVYQQIQNKWKRNFNLLEAFMEQIEKKWYMSPFELAVFSYYFETRQAILFAEAKLDEWYNEIKQSPHMRIALNKVNVSLTHFLLDPKGKIYFINMEDAAFATPIYDLFLMFMNLSEAEPTVSDQNVQYISDYEKVLPLTKTERLLLVSYLSYPAKLVKLVRQYQKKKSEKGELEYCKQLLRAYWQMKNTGYIALKWNEKLENDSLASE